MRVQRSENGRTTNYLGKLFEHNVTLGSFTKHYLLGGKIVAVRGGLDDSSPVSFLLTDHLGSTTATVFAGTGGLQSLRQYTAWGEEYSSYEVTPTGYRYTSQRWDSGLGLYDYNARYYDPALGKFISADTLVPDPAAPQQYNRYTYSLNSPLVFVDPSGHCTQYAGVNDAELSACLEAWNSLGNSYLDLWQLGGMESYPNELMNELLQNGTTDEIQILLDTMDTSVSAFREYKWNEMHSGCTPTWGGVQKCAPDDGWPEYYPGTEEYAREVIIEGVVFLLLLPIGPAVSEIMPAGKGFSYFLEKFLITSAIKNPLKYGIYYSVNELSKDLQVTETDMIPSILTATSQDQRVNTRYNVWLPKQWQPPSH